MNQTFNESIEFLKQRLQLPLPGIEAQALMMPETTGLKYHPLTEPPVHSRRSAILCLLTPSELQQPEILFTLRSNNLSSHKGQISFPGGRCEPYELPHETALRETHEEVGIPPETITIIGSLTKLYVPPSNSLIYPIIGYCNERPTNIQVQPEEVQEVFFTGIKELLDKNNVKLTQLERNGILIDTPYFDIHHTTKLWGATAMILGEVCSLFQEFYD
ncbi:MAG: CoA pyrophosphatase [Ignavibacteriae bacterium]|nr:CoA pyrophosphatase [Ignavibacteriota bacterium]